MRHRRPIGILFVILIAAFATSLAAQTASLSVDPQRTDVGPAIAGTNLNYAINVNNEGPDDAQNVVLDTSTPTNTTFVSLAAPAGWSCTTPAVGGTGTIQCTVSTLPPGTAQILLSVTTPSDTPQGTVITLDSTVSSTTADPDSHDNTNSYSVPLVWQAFLSISKTGPATAFSGAIITYTVTVTDPGPSSSADNVITDVLPADLLFVGVSGSGWSCTTPPVGSNGTVQCTSPQIDVGTSTLTIQASTSPSNPGTTVTNSVSVTASTDPASPRTASLVTQISPNADITVSKASTPATPIAGSGLTYTIDVVNNGPSDASNVVLNDPLPPALEFQSLTAAAGWTCTMPAVGSSGTISCSRTTFAVGASQFVIQANVPANTPAGTPIVNTVTVTSSTADPTTPNTATTTATSTSQADLSVTKIGSPDPVIAGNDVTWSIQVTNAGPSDAAAVSLADTIPPNTTFVSLNQTSGSAFSCTSPPVGSTGTVTCTVANLPLSASASFDLVTRIDPSAPNGGTIGNMAAISSSAIDSSPGNDTATANVNIATQADLDLSKTGPSTIAAGADLTYTLTLTNLGISSAANVDLSDTVPANTTFVSAVQTGGPSFTCITPPVGGSGAVTCTIGTLIPSSPATFAFTVRSGSGLPAGTSISNTATATTSTTDSNPANDTSTTTTQLTESADLAVTKTGPASAQAGSNVTYTVSVVNNGPSDASDVTLTDALPASETFASATQTAGPAFTCTYPPVGDTGTITCTIATLPAGITATFELTVALDPHREAAVTNTATVSASTSDPTPGNGSASSPLAVIGGIIIPTLSPLAMAFLALLLGITGVFVVPRFR
ncbi:MAG: DUF11 domain-containing protein [Thermoanaerobaculia bacterium]